MIRRLPLVAVVLFAGFLARAALGQSADLSLTLGGPSTVVAQYDTATLPVTIALTNSGSATAQNVVVDFSPGPLAGFDIPSFNCLTVTDHVRCTAASFASNTVHGTGSMFLQQSADGTVVTISATVSSTTADPNPANNTSSVTETVVWRSSTAWDGILPVDVVTPGAYVGGNIGFDISGPSYASDVKVTFSLPQHATFNAAHWPQPFACVTPPVGSAGDVVCTAKQLSSSALSIDVDMTIDPATPIGTKLAFTATMTCSDAAPLEPLQSVVTVVEPANLVTSLASPASAEPGDTFANTVTVRNTGPAAAVDTQVNFTVSSGTSIISASGPPDWNCTVFGPPQSHTVAYCFIHSFPVGTATFSFPTFVATPGPAKLTESANAVSGSLPQDASATATTWVHRDLVPDFDLTILAPPIVHPGGSVTYKIDVTSTTPNLAISPIVWLTTTAPSTSIRWINCPFPLLNTCPLGSMAGGSHLTLFATAPVVADAASKMTATAEIRGGLFLHDPRATVISSVVPTPSDLAVALTAAPITPTIGDTVTFTILVTNTGQVAANGVTVHAPLPASLAFVSSTSPGHCTGDADVQCSIGPLAPGAWSTTTIAAQALEPGTINVTATATMDAPDPETSNNSATVPITISAPVVRRRAAHH